ncbi:FAD-dependent oxidoreductase [Amycolatopsis sp. lyj-23]|uniref:FAD-dependent oxidoreductase n=1 Tax=Amycolatopsis sp. lyj-23 TaxID=2789283 RepID=UPI003979D9F7
MSTTYDCDLAIVGGGAVGLATAYHAGRRGHRTVLLDRRQFLHDDTASAGTSRQFRIQYNDPAISRLVLDSIPLWDQLSQDSGEQLATRAGCLWFGDSRAPGAEGQIEAVLRVMDQLDVPFEGLTAQQVTERFGFRGIPPWWSGFFQPDGAATDVKATLRALLRGARAAPHVTLLPGRRVIDIDVSGAGISLSTECGNTVHAAKLVVAAGPESNDVLRLLGFELRTVVWEMISAYFRAAPAAAELPTWINFQATSEDDPGLYYGFPALAWDKPGYARVGANYPSRVLRTPAQRSAEPEPAVVARIGAWVAEHMPVLDPVPVGASTCTSALFTAPDRPGELVREMLVDFAPDVLAHHRDIVVCATGWVFKIVPLLGAVCADLALDGRTAFDMSSAALRPELWHPTVRQN